jgi:hypothetical protein
VIPLSVNVPRILVNIVLAHYFIIHHLIKIVINVRVPVKLAYRQLIVHLVKICFIMLMDFACNAQFIVKLAQAIQYVSPAL